MFSGIYGPTWMTYMVIAGKTSIISAFYINFSITGEMAPTLFRNLAVGSCSAFGKIGSFTAPYLMYLGQSFNLYILFTHLCFKVLFQS